MKARVQIISDIDDYNIALEKWESDPLVFEKPKMNIQYADYNLLDEMIIAYRIMEESANEKKGIYIMTEYLEMPYFVIDYDEEKIKELDEIIDLKNTQFRNFKY